MLLLSIYFQKRNVIIIGRTGSGKSTLVNKIVGKEIIETKFSCHADIKQIAGKLEIDDQPYDITLVDTIGLDYAASGRNLSNTQILTVIQEAITDRLAHGVNLILITLNLQQLSVDDIKIFEMLQPHFKPKFWKLSILILTHCDLLSETAIKERIQDFKSNKAYKEIVEKFEGRIVTVGFFSLDHIKEENKEKINKEMQRDVRKLLDIIENAHLMELPKNIVSSNSRSSFHC